MILSGVFKLVVVQQMSAFQSTVTSNLTENREENNNARDCGVGVSHRGVSVVMYGNLSMGGAIQRLE